MRYRTRQRSGTLSSILRTKKVVVGRRRKTYATLLSQTMAVGMLEQLTRPHSPRCSCLRSVSCILVLHPSSLCNSSHNGMQTSNDPPRYTHCSFTLRSLDETKALRVVGSAPQQLLQKLDSSARITSSIAHRKNLLVHHQVLGVRHKR